MGVDGRFSKIQSHITNLYYVESITSTGRATNHHQEYVNFDCGFNIL